MARARALFVTGTDTGVGKTRVAAAIVRSLRARGAAAVGFKPILCGEDRSDAESLLDASGAPGLSIDEVNPVWLQSPVSPLSVAATIDRCAILDTWECLATRFDFVVIEGAGGWEVPISATETFASVAKDFAAPVLLVAANRLGVLNHTKLTADAIARAGLPCAGIVLNDTTPPDPTDLARQTNPGALRRLFPDLTLLLLPWDGVGDFIADTIFP